MCGLLGSVGSGIGLLRHLDTFLGLVAVDSFSLGPLFLALGDYLVDCVSLLFFFLIVKFLLIGSEFVF